MCPECGAKPNLGHSVPAGRPGRGRGQAGPGALGRRGARGSPAASRRSGPGRRYGRGRPVRRARDERSKRRRAARRRRAATAAAVAAAVSAGGRCGPWRRPQGRGRASASAAQDVVQLLPRALVVALDAARDLGRPAATGPPARGCGSPGRPPRPRWSARPVPGPSRWRPCRPRRASWARIDSRWRWRQASPRRTATIQPAPSCETSRCAASRAIFSKATSFQVGPRHLPSKAPPCRGDRRRRQARAGRGTSRARPAGRGRQGVGHRRLLRQGQAAEHLLAEAVDSARGRGSSQPGAASRPRWTAPAITSEPTGTVRVRPRAAPRDRVDRVVADVAHESLHQAGGDEDAQGAGDPRQGRHQRR